jgi:diacylglycerol kinase family enzyme
MERMLVIENPHATRLTAQLRERTLRALVGGFAIEHVRTEGPGHARALAAAAASQGFGVVGALGGDGTANEVANGIADQSALDCALALLPAGQANVLARMLALPGAADQASFHYLHTRARRVRIDLGAIGQRRFTFAAGLGIDAAVTRRVDSRPDLKARFGPWLYAAAALATLYRDYRSGAPTMRVQPHPAGSSHPPALEGVTTIIQNGNPYTYFRRIPVALAPGGDLRSGTLAGCVLRAARLRDVPSLALRALLPGAQIARHPRVAAFGDIAAATIEGCEGARLPAHVDGDFIGRFERVELSVAPGALAVLA